MTTKFPCTNTRCGSQYHRTASALAKCQTLGKATSTVTSAWSSPSTSITKTSARSFDFETRLSLEDWEKGVASRGEHKEKIAGFSNEQLVEHSNSLGKALLAVNNLSPELRQEVQRLVDSNQELPNYYNNAMLLAYSDFVHRDFVSDKPMPSDAKVRFDAKFTYDGYDFEMKGATLYDFKRLCQNATGAKIYPHIKGESVKELQQMVCEYTGGEVSNMIASKS